MTNYLISFPSAAMVLSGEDLVDVVETSHAVVDDMREAGVLVFAGGLDDQVGAVRVDATGAITDGPYPQRAGFDGGFTVIDVPSREEATVWAARVAAACRCDQELRAFGEGSAT